MTYLTPYPMESFNSQAENVSKLAMTFNPGLPALGFFTLVYMLPGNWVKQYR